MNSERRDLQIQIQCKYNSNTSMDGLGGPSNTFNLLDISHHCLHLQNHPMPETTKWKRRWSQGSFCSKPIAPLGYNSAAVSLVSFKSDRSRREFWWDFLSPTYFDGQIWDLDWRMHILMNYHKFWEGLTTIFFHLVHLDLAFTRGNSKEIKKTQVNSRKRLSQKFELFGGLHFPS